MKLVIDAVGNKNGGGATVLQEILRAAMAYDRLGEITLLASPAGLREFALPDCEKLRIIDVATAESSIGRLRWAARGLDNQLNTLEFDVFLGLNGIGSVQRRFASLVFIQQLLPYSPEALRRSSWKVRFRMTAIRWVTRRSAKAADHILVQSEAMRATISRAFGLHPERISAFLPTAPTLSGTQAKSPKLDILRAASGRRVILYVGNESPHRNLEVLERGLQQFPEAERPNWFATLPGNSPFCRGGSAIGLGTLKRDELYEAYRSATVLVMPSLAETVGLPMLEAMRLGTPVLAADRPYAHQVCEDAAEFFDPLSPFDFARKARGLFTDTGRRASLVERGRRLVERRDKLNPYRSMLQKAMEVAEKVARQRGKTESE